MEALPTVQTAIVAGPDGDLFVSTSAPVPCLRQDHVIVQIHAVAVNPVDSKMVGRLATPGAISGFDFAGVIWAIGPDCSDPGLFCGDRVCGAVTGQNPLDPTEGSFAEYTIVPSHAVLKMPPSMQFPEASSLGVGVGTVGLALRAFQLPPKQTVLVYGASTATGTLATQLLAMFGHHVLATCSPHNFPLVLSRGANSAFDYNDASTIANIKSSTKNSLKYILDCISDAESTAFCHQCMGRAGGKYIAVGPLPDSLQTRKTIKCDWVLQLEVLGKDIGWPAPFKRRVGPETRQWAAAWYKEVQALLDEDRLKAHPVRLMTGGLHDVLGGLEMLRRKEVSGHKLVYRLR